MANGMLIFRKRADKTDESQLAADLPGAPPGTWPLHSVEIVGDPPGETTIGVDKVAEGIREGWIVAEGHEFVVRPAGPPGNKWGPSVTGQREYVFHHYDTLTICGVKYTVTHQPDKYAAEGDDSTPVTDQVYDAGATRVDHFYGLTREG